MSEKRADVYEQEESSAELLVPTIGMVRYVFEEIFLQERDCRTYFIYWKVDGVYLNLI